MCNKAYDDVTDFEVCGFAKSTKIQIAESKILFFFQKMKKFTHYTLMTTT